MAKRKSAPKPPPLDRKAALIQAACDLLIEKGPLAFRLKDLAVAAKVDPPLIHYYFKSIDELQLEVFLVVRERMRNTVGSSTLQGKTATEKLKGYITSYFRWSYENRGFARLWVYFYSLAITDPVYRKLNTEIRTQGRERIRMMLYEGIEAGEFRLEANEKAETQAILIQGLITGNALMSITEESVGSERKFEKETLYQCLKWAGADRN